MNSLKAFARAVALGLAFVSLPVYAQIPAGSLFTYQGELLHEGAIIDGDADLQFTLWDDENAGSQVAGPVFALATPVSNGRFTVHIDFGAAQLYGDARWLEIEVRTPAGVGNYVTLSPRQRLTPAPYAVALSLPYAGRSADIGNAFSVTNTGLGRAGNFSITNVGNPEAAVNATTLGSGPAGFFLNDSGGPALRARATSSGVAVEADTPGFAPQSRAVHARITNQNAGPMSAAVRGEHLALDSQMIGVWGSAAGAGWGVYGLTLSGHGLFGEGTGNFGNGVYGVARGVNGIGVFGQRTNDQGADPAVRGQTASRSEGAIGVHGLAVGTAGTVSYGVLGESVAPQGVGVRGNGNFGVEGMGVNIGVRGESTDRLGQGVYGTGSTGVYGIGTASGVTGQAGDSASFGVHAVGSGGALSLPALRADNQDGPAIYALGRRAVEGEGTEVGVRGVSWEPNGVGGSFTNFAAGGTALRVTGKAEVVGTMTVNVLEIMGGADLAERFPFEEEAEPGMVVEIDPDQPGQLRISREAYNRRVAGVISGANELNPGVVLGIGPGGEHDLPVALSGRVWVKCDTRDRHVEPGDLLTTSDLAGHAKPVVDRDRADGAIIGKAMSRLDQGSQGMVLVLVNLQ